MGNWHDTILSTTRDKPASSELGIFCQTPQHGHRHKTAHDHPKSVHNSYATSHHLRKTHCSRGKQSHVRSLIEVHEGTGLDRSATKTTNYQRSTHGNPNTYRLIQTLESASSQRYNYDTPPLKSMIKHTKILTNDSSRLHFRLYRGFSGPKVARKQPHNFRNKV